MKQLSSLKSKKTLLAGIILTILAASTIIGISVSAHAIDYVAMNISPASMFNGGSGNFTVNGEINGGSSITFDIKYQIVSQGATTTFPVTIGFGASTQTKPAGATDPVVSGLINHTFTSTSSTFTDSITITAPATPGAYTVKIDAVSGTSGGNGLRGGNGIVISFTVKTPVIPSCNHAATSIAISLDNNGCIVYHQPTTGFSATLTSGGSALQGKLVEFTVDGSPVGSAYTDINGVANLTYNSGSLTVGNHTVVASFAGDSCDYNASSNSATLGVNYVFVGYQQPINADGSSLFGGRTIPVKIKIADFYGASVPDAEAYVFFAFGTPSVVGTEAEPVANTNGDSGNAMRYDASAGQYIFNWDIAGLQNGTYTIRVGLGEAGCGDPHTVVVSLKKKGSK